MGNFLSSISADLLQLQSKPPGCWVEDLQQVREYHGYFKYVCDSLIITHDQSKEIFGNLDKARVWDP